MKTLDVLLIDDEENACINLQDMLTKYVDSPLNIVGTANTISKAEEMITELKPDAIFLDIDMQTENAFNFLSRLSPFTFEIIFVTAYDEYAIRALRLNAIDYILKPIDIDELRAAVKKLEEKFSIRKADNIFPGINNHKTEYSKITFRTLNNVDIVDFKDILFITAVSNYSRILFLKNGIEKEIIVSNTLMEYEDLLPKQIFFRVHRSYLVNRHFISNIQHNANGYEITISGYQLPVSRRKQIPLMDFLKSSGDV